MGVQCSWVGAQFRPPGAKKTFFSCNSSVLYPYYMKGGKVAPCIRTCWHHVKHLAHLIFCVLKCVATLSILYLPFSKTRKDFENSRFYIFVFFRTLGHFRDFSPIFTYKPVYNTFSWLLPTLCDHYTTYLRQ